MKKEKVMCSSNFEPSCDVKLLLLLGISTRMNQGSTCLPAGFRLTAQLFKLSSFQRKEMEFLRKYLCCFFSSTDNIEWPTIPFKDIIDKEEQEAHLAEIAARRAKQEADSNALSLAVYKDTVDKFAQVRYSHLKKFSCLLN